MTQAKDTNNANNDTGFMSIAYFGNRILTRAELEQLQAGDWTIACLGQNAHGEACTGQLRVHGITGSPLSGSGKVYGRCSQCAEHVFVAGRTEDSTIGRLFTAAQKLANLPLFGENVRLG